MSKQSLHDLTEQVERFAMMALLLLFGGALVGGLLAPLRLSNILLVLMVLLLVRPVSGMIGLVGLDATKAKKFATAFFGIRGAGSIYYLGYGLNPTGLPQADRLWASVGLAVLLSILLHGITVTPAMRWLDRIHGRDLDTGESLSGPIKHESS